jgi:hypothetical protein
MNQLYPHARAFFLRLAETLREIFDESAYSRFLLRRGLIAGRESYAAFLRERELSTARKPRCC